MKTSSIATNKKSITLLPFSQSNSRRRFNNLKSTNFNNVFCNNIRKNHNQNSFKVNRQKNNKSEVSGETSDILQHGKFTTVIQNIEVVGKSYNNKSHIIFNEFLHISQSKSKSISKIKSKKNSVLNKINYYDFGTCE